MGRRQQGAGRQGDRADALGSVNSPRQGKGSGRGDGQQMCPEAQYQGSGKEKVMTLFAFDVQQGVKKSRRQRTPESGKRQ